MAYTPIAFPTWAYNATQPAILVVSQAQLTALGAGWQLFPFPASSPPVPSDPGFVTTDTRLQQMVVEARVTNVMLQQALVIPDDLTMLRSDELANDSSLSS